MCRRIGFVAVLDTNYRVVDTQFAPTIAEIWQYILAAKEQDEINSARFNAQGVPVDVKLGRWAIDSGVRYEIRAFEMKD